MLGQINMRQAGHLTGHPGNGKRVIFSTGNRTNARSNAGLHISGALLEPEIGMGYYQGNSGTSRGWNPTKRLT